MTFLAWLRHQRDREDPIGDFARDALETKDHPKGRVTYQHWVGYLACQPYVCYEAKIALAQAWRQYRKDTRLKSRSLPA